MYRTAAASLACLALVWPTAAVRAADAPDLIGTWKADHDGYTEIWTIAQDKGDWSVSGVFSKKGKEVGAFKGADVQYADGKLSFTQKWSKKPDPTWGDNTKMVATANGDKLSFTWDNGGGNSGTHDMVRVKTGGDGADLAGLWQVEHDGYNEVWNIQTKGGAFAVQGAFFKKGRQVGSWVGVDPKFADGKLVCTQKWLVKPEATWSDGNTMTAQLAGDKLDFTWDNNAGQSGTREMTRAK